MDWLNEQSRSSWRQLEREWEAVGQRWSDSTADYFAANFWDSLATETQNYLEALTNLATLIERIDNLDV